MVSISIKVTVPKEKFADEGWVNEMARVMRTRTGPLLKLEFQNSTNTWKKKPTFVTRQTIGSDEIKEDVYTYDKIYGLVNAGSPPHIITPIKKSFLRFRTGYASKSKVGTWKSFVGGSFGNWAAARKVSHPGFEARKFDQQIAEYYLPKFQKDVQDALNKFAK